MKKPRNRNSPPREARIDRVLATIAIILAAAIVCGTLFGLITSSRAKKLARDFAATQSNGGQVDGRSVFTLGTIRARSSDEKSAVIIATLSFPYPADDRAFKEELIKKAPALKAAVIAWFSRKVADELHPAYEGTIKAGLRDAFNELLLLGKVEEIWLSDFTVVR